VSTTPGEKSRRNKSEFGNLGTFTTFSGHRLFENLGTFTTFSGHRLFDKRGERPQIIHSPLGPEEGVKTLSYPRLVSAKQTIGEQEIASPLDRVGNGLISHD
jgi:hypothetical protein